MPARGNLRDILSLFPDSSTDTNSTQDLIQDLSAMNLSAIPNVSETEIENRIENSQTLATSEESKSGRCKDQQNGPLRDPRHPEVSYARKPFCSRGVAGWLTERTPE